MISLFRRRFVAPLIAHWKHACTPAARRQPYRLALEPLEDRLVMDGTGLPPPTPPPPPPPPPSQNGPVAVNDALGYYFDHAAPIIGDIFANDTDPNPGATIIPGSVTIVTPPLYGTALPDPMTGAILYTPNTLPASQQDSFQYQVRDSLGLVSNSATVTLSPVGDVSSGTDLVPQPDLGNTVTLQPVSINPLRNDVVNDGSAADPGSVTIVGPPLHGSVVVDHATGVVTYTPDFGFVGFETLQYTAATTGSKIPRASFIIVAVYPSAARLQADPLGGTMLVVDGTSGNDTIRFDPGAHPGDVMVTENGVTSRPFHPTSRIVAFGYAGDDTISVAHAITLPTVLDGGGGNDILQTGGGSNFVYDPSTRILTISGAKVTVTQATTADAQGTTHTTYTFTVDGESQSFADTQLSQVVVNAQGVNSLAILVTNDTFVSANGQTHETAEVVVLGAGGGVLSKFDADGNLVPFLQLKGFLHSYAYLGHADSGQLTGTLGYTDTFVTAGSYSYMSSSAAFSLISGGSSVYGHAANRNDQAWHYDTNALDAFVSSGNAFSYMSGTDSGQAFFNVAVGFNTAYAFSLYGRSIAYVIDSPGTNVFYASTAYSYLSGTNGGQAYFNEVQGFALVYAQSFTGGTDYIYNYNPLHTVIGGSWITLTLQLQLGQR
jgi:hypothetical protein